MNQIPETSFWLRCTGSSPEDRRNQLVVAAACLLWALVFVGCRYLLAHDRLPEGWARWAAATVPMIAGVVLVITFLRFLRSADEFQRLAQLQALGVGFGLSFFLLAGYPLFEIAGAPSKTLEDATSVMPFFYVAGMLTSWWRYR